MSEIPKWWIKGDWFDVCNCGIPCPCTFAQAANGPPGDTCEGVAAWHINEGIFGDVRLDGLNVLEVLRFTGNIWLVAKTYRTGKFIDDRADEQQREALELIWSGRAGGMIANFSAETFEDLGFATGPIEFEVAEDLAYWRARIPGLVEAYGEALTGPTCPEGARVQLINPPGSETGSGPATWGVATQNSVEAFGFNFEWSGRSSKHIPFDWCGP